MKPRREREGPAREVEARICAPEAELSKPAALDDIKDHGWVATAQTSTSVGPVKLISLHARTQGSAVAHIETLLNRLSDAIAGSFILAGDFNSCRRAEQVWPGYRHLDFFESSEARYGMVNCFWKEHGCEQRTYWPACRDAGEPFQADHVFVSADLQSRVRSCRVLNYEALRAVSDDTPMVLTIDL